MCYGEATTMPRELTGERAALRRAMDRHYIVSRAIRGTDAERQQAAWLLMVRDEWEHRDSEKKSCGRAHCEPEKPEPRHCDVCT